MGKYIYHRYRECAFAKRHAAQREVHQKGAIVVLARQANFDAARLAAATAAKEQQRWPAALAGE
jgi:hypothetical protein